MFDHLGIVVRDLAKSRDFYAASLEPLGIRLLEDHGQADGSGWLVFGTTTDAPFFVVAAGRPSFWRNGQAAALSPVHLAFEAPSDDAVDRFHAAGLVRGGVDNGPPGARAARTPWYAAYLLDPDGNNVEDGFRADVP